MEENSKDAFVYSTCLKLSHSANTQLKNENSRLIAQINKIKSEYFVEVSKNDHLEAQIQKIKKENISIKEQNAALLNQLSNINLEFQNQKARTVFYEKQFSEINKSNIELKNLNSQLIKTISINKQIFSDQIEKLKKDNLKLNNELFKWNEEVKEKNKKLKQFQLEKEKNQNLIDDLEKLLHKNDSQLHFGNQDFDKAKEKLFNLPFFEQNGFSNEDISDVNFPHLLFSLLLNTNATEQQQAEFIENIKRNCKDKDTSNDNEGDNNDDMKSDNDDDMKSDNDDDNKNEKGDIPFESALPKHVVHLKRIIADQNILTNSVHKYAKNYFGQNIEELLFYIIEPILDDVLFLPRILDLIRLVKSSNNQKYYEESLFVAFRKFIEIECFDNKIILVLQCAFSSGLISLATAHQIIISIIPDEFLDNYNHVFDYKFNKNKESTLSKDKEIYNLKKQIESLKKPTAENKENQEHIYNVFLNTILQNESKEPEGRRYNDFFYSVCTIAYIYGAKSYNFMRNFLPLPSESVLRDWFSPSINSFLQKVFDINMIEDNLKTFIPENYLSQGFNATIAVDAAKFKEISGQKLIELFPECLKHIKPKSMYNDIFVYYLQAVEVDLKPFPIYIELTENGNASSETLETLLLISEILSRNKIITRYVATDGDKQFDDLHDEFFKIVWNMHCGGKSFPEIIHLLIANDTKRIPISDFLHSIKLLRSYFAKSGIKINNYAVSKPEDLNDNEYQLGKTLIDLSQNGKMKDHYPLSLFSSETIETAIKKNQWEFVFYAVPFNFMINAIRNPFISIQLRQQMLETSFYFLLYFFHECKSEAPIHSRIGIIRIINTIVGISLALENFDFVHIGHISTHPLENYFGMFRIACKNDHSAFNILRAIGKSVIVKKKLDELNLSDAIRTRLSISGAKVDYTCIGGKLMDQSFSTPFQLFKLLWSKIIWPETDVKDFVEWFTSYKPVEWSERISGSSSLSGSNIVSRYYFQKISNNKNKRPKKVSKHIIRHKFIQDFTKPDEIDDDVLIAFEIESPHDFYIQIYGIVNEKRETLETQFEDTFDELNFYKSCTKNALDCLENW